jgi:hypothetical protein
VERAQRHRHRAPRSAGQTDYNDFGLFSSGTCLQDGTTCEPALNTPFAPYHAIDLVDTFADPGDQLIQVNTGDRTGEGPCGPP